MSDGPHRSLKMRKEWKRLCKLADNAASWADEVCDAVCPALEQDWRGDVPAALFNTVHQILSNQLFADQCIAELEALRRQTAGLGFARSFLDCAIEAAAKGETGPNAIFAATQNALVDRAARGMRQAEEHYHRESTAIRADNLRMGLETAIQNAPIEALARRLVNPSSASATALSTQHQGVDEGVQRP